MTSLADTTPNFALRQTIRTLEAEIARLSSGFHESCFARIEALESKMRAEQTRHTAEIYRLSNERDAERAECARLKVDASNHAADAATVRRERDAAGADAAIWRSRYWTSNEAVEELTHELQASMTFRDMERRKVANLRALLREARGHNCDHLHHAKQDRHGPTDPCPVLARIDAALAEGESE